MAVPTVVVQHLRYDWGDIGKPHQFWEQERIGPKFKWGGPDLTARGREETKQANTDLVKGGKEMQQNARLECIKFDVGAYWQESWHTRRFFAFGPGQP